MNSALWVTYVAPVLDILLLSFLYYRLLKLLRGAYTVYVVVGLAVLMGFSLLVQWMRLPTMGWLFENIWGAAVVLLVVLFQPELRMALARLGSHPMGRLLSPQQLSFLDEIFGAVEEAMKRQIGLLIVLQQEVNLRNYAETGTFINGEISKELLLSIFHYRSPLHDGAAIIEGDRLVAVGCLLPLSNDPTLAKILGTRHRAALGLAEFTDAWVIVVSEETGTLSLARDGRLERELTLDSLREQVTALYEKAMRQ